MRANNEDSHGHAWLDDGSLFVVVADGMGGHEAGEVASGLAVRVLEDAVARDAEDDPRGRIYSGLIEVNEAILEEGRRSGTGGMGTTAITAILRGSEVYVGLIGDSRLYHVRRGQLVWRTLDHTRVQTMIDRGEITEEAGRTHPEAGMLTRALGHSRMADGRPLVPDVLAEAIALEEDDVLLLCSDGVHDLIDDWEVAKLLAGRPPEESAEALVAMANERGGHDNITVAVIVAGEIASGYDPDFVPPKPVLAAEVEASEPTESPEPQPSRPPPGEVHETEGNGIELWMILAVGMVGVLILGLMLLVGAGAAIYLTVG